MDTQAAGPLTRQDNHAGRHQLAPGRPRRAVVVGRALVGERAPHRPAPIRPATPVDVLAGMAGDYERAMYCRARVEEYRRRWFAGRAREIAYVRQRAAAGDRRFRYLTSAQIDLVGRLRWSESGIAQVLAHREERYIGWMTMYLAFAQYQRIARAA